MPDTVHVPCPHCTVRNDISRELLGNQSLCASCAQALFEGKPIELDTPRFDAIALRGDLPVLVHFWAAWSGTSLMLNKWPMMSASQKWEPRMRFAKVNGEAHPDLVKRYGIPLLPGLYTFYRGQVVQHVHERMTPISGQMLDRMIWFALNRL